MNFEGHGWGGGVIGGNILYARSRSTYSSYDNHGFTGSAQLRAQR